MQRALSILVLTAAALWALAPRPAIAADTASTGVVVVTPDRGFLGNEETRDAFARFADDRNAELVFVTDKRSKPILEHALAAVAKRGARHVVVLPLVVSAENAKWQLAKRWLDNDGDSGERVIAPVYGRSYLAAEDLSARLRNAPTDKKRLLLVGYGAGNAAAAKTIAADLKRIARFASSLDADAIDTVVYPVRNATEAKALRKTATDAIKAAHGAQVLPLAFAPRDDSMMSFANWYRGDLPKDADAVASKIASADALAEWMARATAAASFAWQPADKDDVGVIVLAHGASWFWNHDIMDALKPVSARYKVAWAFSMADPVVVERAVRTLEDQGVRGIVLVRVFGMASSFRSSVLRMIGADVDNPAAHAAHHGHGGHHGMGMMMMGHGGMSMAHATLAAAPRIRSSVPIVTVGGVNASPLFAKALLANARKLSRDPARETVIVVAHGQGDDAANQKWLTLLNTLADEMRADGGSDFRAIKTATWREDWPQKRDAAIAEVRKLVEAANADGGRALVIPARTNGRGSADRYLKGLSFGWGQGFAQTPWFAKWVKQQIDLGFDKLDRQRREALADASMHHH